ncbi:ferredoxin, partial [Campylobacter coli]|nr:ferredoxin [Campylobacter coli]EAL7324081.1 ferredoxin [Campylobacter coli]
PYECIIPDPDNVESIEELKLKNRNREF